MHSPTKMPQNGGTTALLLVLCLAFPGPVLAEDPHGWLLGVGISSGSFSVVADGENRWSGQFQDDSMQAIEGGYLTPKLNLFGPIGLDMLFRTTWTSFESQSISEPSGQADSRETTNVPLSSDLSITAQEAIARLHLNFAKEGAGGFRVGFAGGWIRSDIEGDVYLTHASNRSDSCASAVETQVNGQIEASCENYTFNAVGVQPLQRIELLWLTISEKGGNYFRLYYQKPVVVEEGKYSLIYTTNWHFGWGLVW